MNAIMRARTTKDERGIALIMVIAIGSVLSILMVAAISYSIGTTRSARATQNFSGAVAAAYAGVEEYQSRLAADTTYFQYGDPAGTFSGSTVHLPPAAAANPAFGLGAAGSWADVAGSGGLAQYRYEVDSANYYLDGKIRLRSTGLVDGETRSIVADLKQQGFINFLYFTDYEIQDPQLSGASVTSCVKHAWAGRATTGCSEIAFGGGDVINGPAHSNDTMRVCDATFKGAVTTAYNPDAPLLRFLKRDSNYKTCSGATFNVVGSPAYSPEIGMPATNSQLKKETRSDLTSADVPRPGCLYTGPTTITFNSGGTMTVRSPWTKKTNVVGDTPTTGSAPAACGTPGLAAGQLGSSTGQTITVPDTNVIYVQNVPTSTTNPNYWAATPAGLVVSGGAGGSNGLGYPMAKEDTPLAATAALPAYGFRNGDVFIKGTLKGKVTVAAENNTYVVGDLEYADSARDLLGLVGNNAVFVWNPVNSSKNSLLGGSDRRIDAAILSVSHTFQVQNYSEGGERGDLTINGAIAQKFRGIVHSGSNGYKKDYVYDGRFRYTAPPKFLSPVTVTYGVNSWVEVAPVFGSDGAYS